MRKLIIISLLVTLSACTMPWTKQDISFQGLYNANIESTLSSVADLGELLGINRHEKIDGTIQSNLNVPDILSGSITSEYSGLIDGRNSESFFRDIRVVFASLVSSGSLSADEVGIVSHGADSYLSYKNFADTGMMDTDMQAIIKKYANTWLSLSEQSNIDMSPAELAGYNIGRNLMTKSLSDIKKYATEYPLFRDTADLGMSGSLHIWSVELHKSNILALSKQLTLDLAGTGMTDAESAELAKNLEAVSFSGKIGYDPENPRISLLDGELSVSGSLIGAIRISQQGENGQIRISNPAQGVSLELNYAKTENRYTFDMIAQQAGAEMGKITGYIDYQAGKFRELSIEASAQGMTATLRHTVDGDKFTGKLSAVVGTLEWSGTTSDDQLKSLKINGSAPFGSLSADLTESTGSMIRGPITIKSGTEILMNADLALAIAKGRFALILDVLSVDFPVHFDLDIRAKTTPSNQSVTPPTSTQSFQSLIKEIEALNPSQGFTEISQSESAIDSALSDMDSGVISQ